MKICYVYRKRLEGRYSLENIFEKISSSISIDDCSVEKIYHEQSIFHTIREIRRTNSDVIHITGDVHYLALFLPRNKTILTIHDIAGLSYKKKTFKSYIYLLIWFLLPIYYLKKITVVSDLTKKNLIKYTRVNPEKIHVVSNPVVQDLKYHDVLLNKPCNILQIGTGSHKNLIGLIKAVKGLPIKLLIVGKPNDNELKLLKLNKVIYELHYSISNMEVREIYNRTDILFFASFSEGFGVPIIEAQSAGIPVITSNISPMKEVSGNAAYLVNPHSEIDIRNNIVKIISDVESRKRIIENGLSNITRYQLNSIVKLYKSIYEEIL